MSDHTNEFLTVAQVMQWLRDLRDACETAREELNALDAIGDGDHGDEMARGFAAAVQEAEALNEPHICDVLDAAAVGLLKSSAGAGCRAFGRALFEAGRSLALAYEMDLAQLAAIMMAALRMIENRGRVQVGHKTLIDAWVPAVQALDDAAARKVSLAEGLRAGAEAARIGADSTIPLPAVHGRAATAAGRGEGHIDPGAETTVLFFASLAHLVEAEDCA